MHRSPFLLTSRERRAVALQIRQNSRGRHLLNYSARAAAVSYESGFWLLLSFSFSFLSRKDSRCEIEGIEENSSVGQVTEKPVSRRVAAETITHLPVRHHFAFPSTSICLYTIPDTPDKYFLAEFFLTESHGNNALPRDWRTREENTARFKQSNHH